MGYIMPLLVMAIFLGVFATQNVLITMAAPVSQVRQATTTGAAFVAYRDAVAAYLILNPTFTGTVPAAWLTSLGISSGMQALAGNAITAVGGAGRLITCYATLPAGAVTAAFAAAGNDPSFGIATGNSWLSAGLGAIPQALAITVPNGAVVAVAQIGP